MKIKYDYCKIIPQKNKYIVEYGHSSYKGNLLPQPVKVADRAFSTEKKTCRLSKKNLPVGVLKKKGELGCYLLNF
ncbi:MAG TPA: hypothetical protein ENG48_02210, partial [Candidatus Atribacteria bacterium]|nr:hypothetical protein [Candidatus Atribacteria bacterium]